MAALAASVIRDTRNIMAIKKGNALVATSAQIYKGSLIYTNSSSLAAVCSDLGAAGNFLGVATQEVLGDGTKTVEYEYGHEVLLPLESGVTYAYVGKSVYAMTDNGVTEASTVGPCIGTLRELESASLGWIEICGAVQAANT